MKQTLLALLKLAEIDSKLDRLKAEQIDLPGAAKENALTIQELQGAISRKVTELQNLELKKNEANAFVSEKEVWIKQREERVTEIKTNKEYQASLKEISTAKKEIKDKQALLETLLPEIESLTAVVSKLKEDNEPQIAALKDLIQSGSQRFEALKNEIQKEIKIRTQTLSEFGDTSILKHYERIHSRVTPAMACVNDGVCTECGTRMVPQNYNLLTVGQHIQTCNSCKRILYLEEILTAE